jgi:hypothetical protein
VLSLPAHDLVIEPTRIKGYRDIQAMAATAVKISTATLQFDGKMYRVKVNSTENIR